MSASLGPDVEVGKPAAGDALHPFVDLLRSHDVGPDLTYDDVARASTREELGIGSLEIILLLSKYIDEHGGGKVTFRPEWVSKLDDVDGIVSVIGEIDRAALDDEQ